MAHPCSYCSDVQKDYAEVGQRRKNFGLLVASLVGHYNCVKVFIKKGADVNCYDSGLRMAIGQYMVRTATGENPSAVLDDGTPLMHASACGNIEIVKLLVNEGADVNMIKSQGTALGVAACQGHYKCVEFLIEAGANVNIADTTVTSPLVSALAVPSWTSTREKCIGLLTSMKLLLQAGADVNQTDRHGLTPLHLAVCEQRLFLENIRQNFHKYRTPDRILLETVRMFLEAGVQINKKDLEGRNALVTAISYSKSEDDLNLCMLLYAVGETLDESDEDKIPDYFKELRKKMDLKHLCREAIRKHLIYLDPHDHLFGRIPQLGLPSIVTEYMLYNCTLDCKAAIEEGI